MRADLALMHETFLVRMHELDRIFNGDDVQRARFVDQLDDRRERRRLAAARRAGDENESAANLRDAPHLIGKTELLDGHDLRRDDAEHHACAALLAEKIHAIARHAWD